MRSPTLLDLIQWAVGAGVQFAKVRPSEFAGGLRGMAATFAIAPGEALVCVPQAAAIATHPADAPPPGLAPTAWRALPFYARLAARLVHEAARGPASAWAPYLAVLPGEVPLPALWPPHEVEQLQCSYALQQVHQQQEEWSALHAQLAPWLRSQGADEAAWQRALSLARSRTFAAPYSPALPLSSTAAAGAAATQALAAAAAAASAAHGGSWLAGAGAVEAAGALALAAVAALTLRSAGDPQQQQQQHALCPLIDLINHSSLSQSECEYDLWGGAFRVVATQAYAPGEQVLMSYGAQSNDALLTLYGFVEARNPADRYVLQGLRRKLAAAAPAGVTARAALASTDLDELTLTAAGAPADALAAVGAQLGEPGRAARAALAEVCRNELQGLGSTAEEDEALLAAWAREPACRQALQEAEAKLQRCMDAVAIAEHQLTDRELAALAAASTLAGAPIASQPVSGTAAEGTAAAAPAIAVAEAAVEAEAAQARQQAVLLQQAAQQAGQLVSGLQEELRGLEAATLGLRPVAVQYRREKKRVLAAAIAALEA